MGQKFSKGLDGPSEQLGLGSLDTLAMFGRAKKAQGLFKAQPPGPALLVQVINGREVKTTMPKSVKNAPVVDDEEEIEEPEETEDGDDDEDDEPKSKKGRGNPGNLTPREPVKVSKDVVAKQSEEIQKLLKRREKLLAAGDQKGLRKVRAALRKAGFRLSSHAGKDDLIAAAAKKKAATAESPAKVSKKAAAVADDEDDD
jgi:hypothetical protein